MAGSSARGGRGAERDADPALRHGPGQSVGFLLSQLGWATATRFREAIAPAGLEPRQFAVLRSLAAVEGQSQQAVCSALAIPPSRMVALVDALEERGLVERRQSESDRRARAVYLTVRGRSTLVDATRRAMEHERWISSALDEGERERLLALLGRLAGHYGLDGGVHPDLTARRAGPWPGAPDGGGGNGGHR